MGCCPLVGGMAMKTKSLTSGDSPDLKTELFSPLLTSAASLEVDSSRIKIQKAIGKGRTAVVYRASLDGRDVAVKKFKLEALQMTPLEKKNLQREIDIMKEIVHPLLVNLVGVVSNSGLSIITEFCHGGDLFTLLHTREDIPLAWSQQVKMCCDVAQAMCFLHNSTPQIIHRDLKSLNLLLTEKVDSMDTDPVVKVSDFGQSRWKDKAAMGLEVMTRNVGTQHWMAPEVIRGENYDEKVDVYSYAMIVFEVITREVPFEDFTPKEAAMAAMRGRRPDLEAVPPDCPKALEALMTDCWVEDSKSRPSFEAVVTRLCPVKMLF